MLMNQIKEDWCDVFLHIDKKSSLNPENLLNKLDFKNVYFTKKRHSVNWGSYSTVEAIFELLELVRETSVQKNEKYDRIIFLSGQDFPIANNKNIYSFFENNKDKEFMDLRKIEKKTPFYRRINNVRIYSWLHSENKTKRVLARIVKNIPRRYKQEIDYYYGSGWFNITYSLLEYLLSLNDSENSLLKYFKLASCPDESLFHTLLMDSPFKTNLINDNLRYIIFPEPNVGNPLILKENDFEAIVASGKLFARKFDIQEDGIIIEKLKEMLEISELKTISI